MGVRKKNAADARKEANKSKYFAALKKNHTFPYKIR